MLEKNNKCIFLSFQMYYLWLILLSILNVIAAVQIGPASFKIVQHHGPLQSQYAQYYTRKPTFLTYTRGLAQSYIDGDRSIYR